MESEINKTIEKLNQKLMPGDEKKFTPAQLGAAGNTFLMIYNPIRRWMGIG